MPAPVVLAAIGGAVLIVLGIGLLARAGRGTPGGCLVLLLGLVLLAAVWFVVGVAESRGHV